MPTIRNINGNTRFKNHITQESYAYRNRSSCVEKNQAGVIAPRLAKIRISQAIRTDHQEDTKGPKVWPQTTSTEVILSNIHAPFATRLQYKAMRGEC